jgi:hypothetical protein
VHHHQPLPSSHGWDRPGRACRRRCQNKDCNPCAPAAPASRPCTSRLNRSATHVLGQPEATPLQRGERDGGQRQRPSADGIQRFPAHRQQPARAGSHLARNGVRQGWALLQAGLPTSPQHVPAGSIEAAQSIVAKVGPGCPGLRCRACGGISGCRSAPPADPADRARMGKRTPPRPAVGLAGQAAGTNAQAASSWLGMPRTLPGRVARARLPHQLAR